jgi:dihydrofolate synthase/folylpolyglutamate synthase
MTYKETLSWMFTRLPMFQREGKTAFKKDLTNSLAFSKHLNFPEKSFKSVHVAGTNGKGSTSHMLASILQESGYSVGLYTSPHLKDFRERIKINGKKISQKEVVDFISKNKLFLENQHLSFFEMTVGMAFFYFASKNVDIAIIEVGLGGRLDSTNIITPLISVITNIGFDHTQFLGETLPEIAFEKAGIIKPNIPVIIGEFQAETAPVFNKIAADKNAKLFFAEQNIQKKYISDLKGNYQEKNIKTVVQTIEILRNSGFKISEEQLINGLSKVVKNTGLLGRWQILNTKPKVICDTAHNKEGLQYVLKQLNEEKFDQLHIVLGVVNDKDLNSVLPLFPKNAVYYFCKPNIPRGLNEAELKLQANGFNLKGNSFKSVKLAYTNALDQANDNDLIFIGGSTFVVAEVV